MYKIQWHFRSDIWWQSWNCKSGCLLFFTFSISALPPLLKCHCTFYMYGPLVKKTGLQIFKRCSIDWIIAQTILKVPEWAEIENMKNDRLSHFQFQLYHQMSLLKCHSTFYIYGPLGKNDFCKILKRWLISWIIDQNVQRVLVFAVFAL